MAALVAGAVALIWIVPVVVLLGVAGVHRLTSPPVGPFVAAARQLEVQVDRADGLTRRSTEVDGPDGCSVPNPHCRTVTCCYLAVVDGHELRAQVVHSRLPPSAEGQQVEVRLNHLHDVDVAHLDR